MWFTDLCLALLLPTASLSTLYSSTHTIEHITRYWSWFSICLSVSELMVLLYLSPLILLPCFGLTLWNRVLVQWCKYEMRKLYLFKGQWFIWRLTYYFFATYILLFSSLSAALLLSTSLLCDLCSLGLRVCADFHW
jgi:hypothetical protein